MRFVISCLVTLLCLGTTAAFAAAIPDIEAFKDKNTSSAMHPVIWAGFSADIFRHSR